MKKHAKTILPMLVIVPMVLLDVVFSPQPSAQAQSAQSASVDKLMFHYNRARTGWNDKETVLTPQAVSGSNFGLLWESVPLDEHGGRPPRLYAAPLYVHAVPMTQGPLAGRTASAVYVVSTAGYVYAINAAQNGTVKPGEILWRKQVSEEACNGNGNLSTPVIDLPRNRIFLTMCHNTVWRVHALDIRSGEQLPGWPLAIDASTVDAPGVHKNGSTRHWTATRSGGAGAAGAARTGGAAAGGPGGANAGAARGQAAQAPAAAAPQGGRGVLPGPPAQEVFLGGPGLGRRPQRGALNLNADASRLYLTFGEPGGWIMSIDTNKPRVASAFSSVSADEEMVMGGIWASGGPSVDDQGNVYVSTGTSGRNGNMEWVYEDSPGNWGQSLLQLRDDPVRGFELAGTYTPFNYCLAASWDVDLASSGVVSIDLDQRTTSTPRVIAIGGAKQGNVYLVNRSPMPGSVTKRPPCSENSESDMSLLSPDPQPQYGGKRGPLHIFPPYAENKGYVDQARSRSTLAYYRDAAGGNFLYVTGAAKTGPDLQESAPPGLVKLQIVTTAGKPAFMRVVQSEMLTTLHNASSPVVTSNGGRDAIVWVLDTNGKRSAPLYGPEAPLAVLYAFDATNLKLLWKSAPGQLATTGKYNEPTVLNGMAIVGTDRIQVFGMRSQATTTR